jgi:hypothetical protein
MSSLKSFMSALVATAFLATAMAASRPTQPPDVAWVADGLTRERVKDLRVTDIEYVAFCGGIFGMGAGDSFTVEDAGIVATFLNAMQNARTVIVSNRDIPMAIWNNQVGFQLRAVDGRARALAFPLMVGSPQFNYGPDFLEALKELGGHRARHFRELARNLRDGKYTVKYYNNQTKAEKSYPPGPAADDLIRAVADLDETMFDFVSPDAQQVTLFLKAEASAGKAREVIEIPMRLRYRPVDLKNAPAWKKKLLAP